MLEFQNVRFRYSSDTEEMLSGLSFSVEEGCFVSLIGASGCGKTTVFRLINGLEKPNGGEILFHGKKVSEQKNFSAYMPQKDLLFPWRTIGKNISLPMELKGVAKKERERQCDSVLEEIGLAQYKDKFPRELSGGMRQRVSFARTLLTGSQILLLDEPFSALDYLTRISMQEWLLRQWEHHHKTILFITHDVEEALFLSQTVLVIQDKPITSVEAVQVPLGYPRTREDMDRPDILQLKERLIQKLRQEAIS